MNDLEQKRQRIEKVVKVLLLLGIGFVAAPFIFVAIKGLIGLLIALTIGVAAINFAPAVAAGLANWKLKALKAAAAANPIETLENQYAERESALLKIRENIKEFNAVVMELFSQIQAHNEQYPDRPSQFLDKYNKMVALLQLRSKKYKAAQSNLKAFGELIEEKRSDWKVAQSAAKAMKLANVGEDFQSKLMQDTALGTIQDGLNMAFSELEVSLLDEQPISEQPATDAAPVIKGTKATAKNLVAPLDLDLDDSPSPRQRIATA
jgi:hypothetical protein